MFLTGLQALARLPLEQLRADRAAGLRTAAFVSGYPGSPLGGYDQALAAAAREAPDLDVVCRPALNEEYAATAVMGSQLALGLTLSARFAWSPGRHRIASCRSPGSPHRGPALRPWKP